LNIERYQILNQLGTGGMGAVFRARDLLTGDIVALKRVNTPTSDLEFASQHKDSDGAIALAGEFRTLAGLHHPNIVTVLDYGFDSEHKPYYIMQLLDGARPLTEAAQSVSSEEKVRLLIDLLQALTYLHRHKVIHRDLKPANVLVDQRIIKVLDFGLARDRHQSMQHETGAGIIGTLAYIAPEVFNDEPPTVQSDLYSVGVMACEMFTGHHPFSTKNIGLMISQTLTQPPNLDGLDARLVDVVAGLLKKDPQHRLPTAEEAIRVLCQATDQPIPTESTAIRESFLQASAFVGRENEIGELRAALKTLHDGQGSAWLIGGESGVGKSRLMEEIRTRALVQGALVLRGQAVLEGGLPYQFWRDVMRQLVLGTQLNDFQASVLKEIVPDISALLGRDIPNIPMLEGKPGQARLVATMQDVFKQQTRPLVLLLEDAQWASESLAPLKALNEDIKSRPWLILVSYRDDEAPDLPARLPGMKVMTLARFSPEVLSDLSVAMLGEAGRRADLIELLHKETEGNAFFLTEVVRALAEEAGSLSAVSDRTLPRHIITGGVLEITRRRLSKVPQWAQPVLKLAAVAGRQIDLLLLTHLKAADSVDAWLIACANAAVLEMVDGRWRFAHDKLRETILADLGADERQNLHRQVAETVETIYPDDAGLAEMLALHWEGAGDLHKAVAYILQTADPMVSYAANYTHAQALLEHGLQLTSPEDKQPRAKIYRWLSVIFRHRSEYAQTIEYATLSLENSKDDPVTTGWAFNNICVVHWQQGNLSEASAYAERGLALANEIGHQELIAVFLGNLGIIANIQGRYDDARTHFLETLRLRREQSVKMHIANALTNLSIVSLYQGTYAEGRRYLEEAIALSEEIGDRAGTGLKANNLALIAEKEGDFHRAQEQLIKAIDIFRTVGNQAGVGAALANLGNVMIHKGQYSEAFVHLEESLTIRQAIGDQWGIASTLGSLSENARANGDYDAAERYAEEGLTLYQQIDVKEGISTLLYMLGSTDFARGRLEQAQARFDESLKVAQDIGAVEEVSAAHLQLSLVAVRQGNQASAEQHLSEAIQIAKSLSKPQKANVLYGMVVLAQRHRAADAAAWSALLELLPEVKHENRRALADLRPTLEASLGIQAYAAAVERGKTRDLDEVLQEWLSTNSLTMP
jgi:tetratricopeptide (TPR) repeat protein